MSKTLDIKKSSLKELEKEYEECMKLWGKYSCDCFGFYVSALQKEIIKRKT